jgi:FeS assembly protein IscX
VVSICPQRAFGLLDHQLITDHRLLMTFTWDSTYAIALELRRQHPDINIEEVSLQQIYQWTIQLNEFEDDLALANDDILYAIYQDWFEENIHGK